MTREAVGKSKRYLAIRVYSPKPEHAEDILAVVRKVAAAAREFEGLVDIGAWMDKGNDRIVIMSLGESAKDAANASREMHPMVADVPWDEWERKPSEDFMGLTRVV